MELVRKAISIDEQLPQAHWVLANVHLFKKEFYLAIKAAKQAIALNPNYADAYATLAVSSLYDNDPESAISLIQKAMRINPIFPARYQSALGQAYYFLGRYEDANTALREATERNPNLLPSRIYLIATLAKLGKTDEAGWEADQLRLLAPTFGIQNISNMFPIENQDILRDIIYQLRRSGFG